LSCLKKPYMQQVLETEQKALEINLDPAIYGTFAEIGAGQEVARYFFQAGAAAGTIAKTMSAYDKIFSDVIYGPEKKGRYVCESRIYKMLEHEYGLVDERLGNCRPDTLFFAFANTVATVNYQRTVRGHGWVGLRFQLEPESPPNDIVLHVNLEDYNKKQQQEAIGILGVNLIYACFRHAKDPRKLIRSLMDRLQGRVSIDMLRLTGPDFEDLDKRLLSYWLVHYGLTKLTLFDANGSIHGSDLLYKQNVMISRGNFRPPTLLHADTFTNAYRQFQEDLGDEEAARSEVLAELRLEDLHGEGEEREADFLDRADALAAMDKMVLLSKYEHYNELIEYLADFRIQKIGLVIGAYHLLDIIREKYERNKDGRLLVSFGEIFTRNVTMYVYPNIEADDRHRMDSQNLPIPEGMKYIYKHLQESGQITDVRYFNPKALKIPTDQVLAQLQAGESGWEESVPPEVVKAIKEKGLFGYPLSKKRSKATPG